MSIKKNISDGSTFSYDICIIGSGPAGMTLAAELADSGKSVCVLESGLEHTTSHNNALRGVENHGEIKIKPYSRERVFGGASTTWGGASAPLEESDLLNRDFLTYPSSWPISLSELIPYYKRVSNYGFPPFEMFDPFNLKDIKQLEYFDFGSSGLEEKIFIAVDPPWNFGERLRHIFDKKNIDLYLNATVTDLVSGEDGDLDKVKYVNIISGRSIKWRINSRFLLSLPGVSKVLDYYYYLRIIRLTV